MLRLRALEVQGFRAFARWTRLELRPLTLLYGRNNAGKSSLLRLLAMLADSVEEGTTTALDTTGPAGRGARFKDLPWVGDGMPRERLRLRLAWERGGQPIGVDEFELAWLDERSRAVVRRVTLRDAEGCTIDIRAEPYPDDGLYRVDKGEPLAIAWRGLVPSPVLPCLEGLRERVLVLRRSLIWLDSNRPRPERIVAASEVAPRVVDHDGSNAIKFLVADEALRREVERWYAAPPISRTLDLVPVGSGYASPHLRQRNGLASFHLLDAGEGMAHVLPVLVAASLTGRGQGHRVLAVEEPESHLHGDTQRSLVRFLAELAAKPDPPILLLETHSRAMLLGLQLAVAEGVLPVDAAQVLWCEQDERGESHLHRVEIMPDGGLRGWPRAALASEAEMVRDLLELQARGEVK